jgi:hypothetical protein
MLYFRRKLAWDLLSGRINLEIEHIVSGKILISTFLVKHRMDSDNTGPGEAPDDERPDPASTIELASALDVLKLDDTDLVENVRHDLHLDDYETIPITEAQRQVVEASASRATHVRFCTTECPSATTPSAWATTLAERIRRFLPIRDNWSALKDSGQLAMLCDEFEECAEECTEGTRYCEDLSKVAIPIRFYGSIHHCLFSAPTASTSSTSCAGATAAFAHCALATAIFFVTSFGCISTKGL